MMAFLIVAIVFVRISQKSTSESKSIRPELKISNATFNAGDWNGYLSFFICLKINSLYLMKCTLSVSNITKKQ